MHFRTCAAIGCYEKIICDDRDINPRYCAVHLREMSEKIYNVEISKGKSIPDIEKIIHESLYFPSMLKGKWDSDKQSLLDIG